MYPHIIATTGKQCQHTWHSTTFRWGKAPVTTDWCINCGINRPGFKGTVMDPQLGSMADNNTQVVYVTDGTTTRAELIQNGWLSPKIVARAVAKRRKGDKRNESLAEALVMARLYRDAADHFANRARRMGVDPF